VNTVAYVRIKRRGQFHTLSADDAERLARELRLLPDADFPAAAAGAQLLEDNVAWGPPKDLPFDALDSETLAQAFAAMRASKVPVGDGLFALAEALVKEERA
jgi:hypothetical protein